MSHKQAPYNRDILLRLKEKYSLQEVLAFCNLYSYVQRMEGGASLMPFSMNEHYYEEEWWKNAAKDIYIELNQHTNGKESIPKP